MLRRGFLKLLGLAAPGAAVIGSQVRAQPANTPANTQGATYGYGSCPLAPWAADHVLVDCEGPTHGACPHGTCAMGGGEPDQATEEALLLQDSPVAGLAHHQADALWAQLTPGTDLWRFREPDNPHDPRAVAVCLGSRQIGYLPRRCNYTPAKLMDRGYYLTATILTRSDQPWPAPHMRIAVHVDLLSLRDDHLGGYV